MYPPLTLTVCHNVTGSSVLENRSARPKGIMLKTLPLAYSSAQHPSSGILYPLATPLDIRCCEPALYT